MTTSAQQHWLIFLLKEKERFYYGKDQRHQKHYCIGGGKE